MRHHATVVLNKLHKCFIGQNTTLVFHENIPRGTERACVSRDPDHSAVMFHGTQRYISVTRGIYHVTLLFLGRNDFTLMCIRQKATLVFRETQNTLY